jgi:hypothetical protein
VIFDPLAFTEVLEGCRVKFPGPVRFTTAADGKFAPRIVSVKVPLPGAVLVGGKLGGDTWVTRGTAFGGTVCPKETAHERHARSVVTLPSNLIIRMETSREAKDESL